MEPLRESFRHHAWATQALIDHRADLPPYARNLMLIQALHHGNDHRTHVCTVLGAHGYRVPELSGWAYWLAKGETDHAGERR